MDQKKYPADGLNKKSSLARSRWIKKSIPLMDQKKAFTCQIKKKSPVDGSKKKNLLLMDKKKSLVDGSKKIFSCRIKKSLLLMDQKRKISC